VVSAATALLLLDVTVVNVALPAIRADLDASFGELLEHRLAASGSRLGSFEGATRVAFVDGLDAIFLIGALTAFAAVPAALLLLRKGSCPRRSKASLQRCLYPFAEP